jgi:hypothetical protein
VVGICGNGLSHSIGARVAHASHRSAHTSLCPPFACSYGFVVYDDARVTDMACAGLNGMRMGDRTLTVRRAIEGRRGADGNLLMPTAAPVLAAPRVVKLASAGQS